MQDQSRTVAVGVWFGRVAGRFEEREDDWHTVAGHCRPREGIVTEYVQQRRSKTNLSDQSWSDVHAEAGKSETRLAWAGYQSLRAGWLSVLRGPCGRELQVATSHQSESRLVADSW